MKISTLFLTLCYLILVGCGRWVPTQQSDSTIKQKKSAPLNSTQASTSQAAASSGNPYSWGLGQSMSYGDLQGGGESQGQFQYLGETQAAQPPVRRTRFFIANSIANLSIDATCKRYGPANTIGLYGMNFVYKTGYLAGHVPDREGDADRAIAFCATEAVGQTREVPSGYTAQQLAPAGMVPVAVFSTYGKFFYTGSQVTPQLIPVVGFSPFEINIRSPQNFMTFYAVYVRSTVPGVVLRNVQTAVYPGQTSASVCGAGFPTQTGYPDGERQITPPAMVVGETAYANCIY